MLKMDGAATMEALRSVPKIMKPEGKRGVTTSGAISFTKKLVKTSAGLLMVTFGHPILHLRRLCCYSLILMLQSARESLPKLSAANVQDLKQGMA